MTTESKATVSLAPVLDTDPAARAVGQRTANTNDTDPVERRVTVIMPFCSGV